MKASHLLCGIFLGICTSLRADPVIKFDDLSTNAFTVPYGYHLLAWTNFHCYDGLRYSNIPNGLSNGVVSANNVVIAGSGFPGIISCGMFDFLSAYLTAACNDNLSFEAKGFIHGTLVYDKTNMLSATTPTLVQFGFYGVDRVELWSSGGSLHSGYPNLGPYFVMDNLSVNTYLPLPFIRNGGFETGDFAGWNQTGSTNLSSVVNDGNYVHLGAYGAKMGPKTSGYLGQIISPTTLGQLYEVSFFLKNHGGSNNSFNVYWNGQNVFGLTNQPPSSFANHKLNLVATRPSGNLQFGFMNGPDFFGFDDVSVSLPGLINNGNFETGNFGGWTPTGNTNNSFVNAASERAGNYGARFGAVGSMGFISQDVTTIPGQPYLISAWLNNVNPNPFNEFRVSWGGQALADYTNVANVGWTNLHLTTVSGSSLNTLSFGFRNDPAFFVFDEVTVFPVPLLKNGGFEFGDFTGWTQSGTTSGTSVGTNVVGINSGFYGTRFGPIGSLGFISQTIQTVPGQAYLLGFMLNSPAGTSNSEFRVSWNGSVLLDITNFNLVGWIPYEFAVTAADTISTVQFGFRDDPAYLGFDDAYVTPVPAPVFQSVAKEMNNDIDMSWSALPGYLYELQYSTNLTQNSWKVLQSLSFPTSFPMSATDTNPPDPQRFYRVRLAPPPLVF